MSDITTIHGFDLPNPMKCGTLMTEHSMEFDWGGGLKYLLLVVFTAGITAIVDLVLWGVQKISGSLLNSRVKDLTMQAQNMLDNGNLSETQKKSVKASKAQLVFLECYIGSNISKLDKFNERLHVLKEVAAELKAEAKKT